MAIMSVDSIGDPVLDAADDMTPLLIDSSQCRENPLVDEVNHTSRLSQSLSISTSETVSVFIILGLPISIPFVYFL